MALFWIYLKPYRNLIVLALILAAGAQLLALTDPVIFEHIIDQFATNKNHLPENESVHGIIYWLLIALSIAIVLKGLKSLQE